MMDFVSVNDNIVNIAQMVRKCPGYTLRRAYTRALREWCQQTQWLRVTLPGETEANVQTYNLGNDLNLDIIGLRAVSLTQTVGAQSQTSGLATVDSSLWNPNGRPGVPQRYTYVPEGRLALDPIPDGVYAITISLIVVPKESGDIGAQAPRDPLIKYSNDIESGALAYLMAIPGMPWSDKVAAELHGREFRASIANGKAEVQRAYNTGSMRARPRPFLLG
jgi:hypothetical protein